MATYVMSDIHGCYDEFMNMLKQINFTDEDQLIIAGDYIDRGPKSYEMLKWLEDVPDNILLIKGNHDIEFSQNVRLLNEFAQSFEDVGDYELKGKVLLTIYALAKKEFNTELYDYYGTLRQLIEEQDVSLEQLLAWSRIIDAMPFTFKTKVNGIRYMIVHGGYISRQNFLHSEVKYETIEEFYIYARDEAITIGGEPGTTVISGHTPTISPGRFFNNGDVFSFYDKKRDIQFYNIDCGCAYRYGDIHNAKLACMRLDDGEIYYI